MCHLISQSASVNSTQMFLKSMQLGFSNIHLWWTLPCCPKIFVSFNQKRNSLPRKGNLRSFTLCLTQSFLRPSSKCTWRSPTPNKSMRSVASSRKYWMKLLELVTQMKVFAPGWIQTLQWHWRRKKQRQKRLSMQFLKGSSQGKGRWTAHQSISETSS